MGKKIVCNFWIPEEVVQWIGNSFELIYPKEAITGRFNREGIIPFLKEVDAVLIDHLSFDQDLIDQAGPQLKVIGRHGVGCDIKDFGGLSRVI